MFYMHLLPYDTIKNESVNEYSHPILTTFNAFPLSITSCPFHMIKIVQLATTDLKMPVLARLLCVHILCIVHRTDINVSC